MQASSTPVFALSILSLFVGVLLAAFIAKALLIELEIDDIQYLIAESGGIGHDSVIVDPLDDILSFFTTDTGAMYFLCVCIALHMKSWTCRGIKSN